MDIDLNNVIANLINWATTTGLKILFALLALMVSFRVITVVTRRIERKLWKNHENLDKTLTNTMFYAVRIVLKTVVIACLIGYLGIDTGAIASLVASLGVCVGLAVNGALSNLAGGVLILITRPFRIDDYIEAQGHSGTVEEIHITQTKLRTPDNKVVYVPNGALSSGVIVNYSMKDTRRVDITFSISYSADFEKAKETVLGIAAAHALVLKEPAPTVRISAHKPRGLDLVCRVWVNSADYWTVNYDMLESVKHAFDEQGIEIPVGKLDVRVKND